MNLENVMVNETHMCVLRKVENEDRVKVDFVELKFKHQDQLDELKRMADNDNRSVLDMQDYVKGSSLRRLSLDFDFCSCLSDSYQWISCIQPVSFADYQKVIDEYEERGDKAEKEAYASQNTMPSIMFTIIFAASAIKHSLLLTRSSRTSIRLRSIKTI